MRRSRFGGTLLVGALAVTGAIAGCNNDHVVSGAKCAPGAATESVGSAASADAVPAGAQQLLDAMDVTAALSAAGVGAASGVSLSDQPKQAAAYLGLGSMQPVHGPSFAWISTGVAGAGTAKTLDPLAFDTQTFSTDFGAAGCSGVSNSFDCATLAFSFVAPAAAHSVAFDFDFMSTEYPEWVGFGFNDTFRVSMASATNNYSNIVYDAAGNVIGIDSLLFTQTCQQLGGTGFQITDLFGDCDAGGTGRLTTTAPITPGETVTLAFQIFDAGDGVLDSAVMIDNFRFDASPVTTPQTGTPTPTPVASPTSTNAQTPTPTPTAADSPTPEPTPACGG